MLILLIGGYTSAFVAVEYVDIFDTKTSMFSSGSLSLARAFVSAIASPPG